jgi:hypothetical protein
MIYHVSIPADDPEHVARVMSEVMGGPPMQFVPGPGSFVVFSGYRDGTSIEVVPRQLRHTPGRRPDEGINFSLESDVDLTGRQHSAFHVAMATPLSTEQILAIGTREGWRALPCWRATAFPLVELWVENRLLLELFPPDMQQQITSFMRDPGTWRQYFGLEDVDGIARLKARVADAQAPADVREPIA